jgi:hypothetical protein
MTRFAITLLLIAGCASPSIDPPAITPDTSTSPASGATSAGAGGLDAAGGAGGQGGDARVASSGAGGGDVGAPGDGGGQHSASGTRLKVASYVGADGSAFVRGDAYDSALDVLCSFVPATDGTVRCMPTPFTATIVYSDSGCSNAVVSSFYGCETEVSKFVSVQHTSDACPPVAMRSFRISNPRTIGTYMRIEGQCYSAGSRLVADAEEMPPSTFVEMSPVVESP